MEISNLTFTIKISADKKSRTIQKIGCSVGGASAGKLPFTCTVLVGDGASYLRKELDRRYEKVAPQKEDCARIPSSAFDVVQLAEYSALSCLKGLIDSEFTTMLMKTGLDLMQSQRFESLREVLPEDQLKKTIEKSIFISERLRKDSEEAKALTSNGDEPTPALIAGIVCCFLLLNKPICFEVDNVITIEELIEALDIGCYPAAGFLRAILTAADGLEKLVEGQEIGETVH